MSKLRELCGDLEDMSVFNDDVPILEVRTRLEPAVDEVERALTAARSEAERLRERLSACAQSMAAEMDDDEQRWVARAPGSKYRDALGQARRALAQEEDRDKESKDGE